MPPAPPIPIPEPLPESEESPRDQPELVTERPNAYRTTPDSYGVLREYHCGRPSITPDELYSVATVSDSPYLATDPEDSPPSTSTYLSPLQTFYRATTFATESLFAPFRNASIYRLMTWFYNSSNTKSMTELNSLIKDVILAPDFKPEDFVGFSASKEREVMDCYQETGSSPFAFDDTWIKGTVEISLPCDGVKQNEADAPKFSVEVHYRKILDVVKAALSEPAAEKFHTFPFKEFWQPAPDEPEERIYSEIYTANRWNEEYEKIYATNQKGPHPDLKAFLVGLMIWSDSTGLAQFGNAQLWPIYLYLGNQLKYYRAKPSSFAAHHIAYMPKVKVLQYIWIYDYLNFISARRPNPRILFGTFWKGRYSTNADSPPT